jgi:penicillin-binding protein 2
MEPKYRIRLFLLTALILMGCGTLLSRLYEFQIDRRAQFVAKIPITHTVEIREPGARGRIVDRNGVVLARNRRSYEIVFNLEDIYVGYTEHKKSLTDKKEDQNKNEKPQLIEAERKAPDDEMIVEAVREWVIPQLESFGLNGQRYTRDIGTHYKTYRGLVPYRYRQDLTADQFAKIAVRSHEIPGVEVRVMPRRVYPYGALAGHIIGYVKQWAKGDIPDEYRGKQNKNRHFQGDAKGLTGVEFTTDEYLKGKAGKRILVRNERNKVIATEDYQPAREGAEVQLTIDSRIQLIVANVMRLIGRGAAVVMDPNTGEVLAMVSVPNFDPNDFIPAITEARFAEYNTNRARPLINRAIGRYIPGSTFKLPTAIAAACHEKTNFWHNCLGFSQFGNTKIRCWKTYGHGSLSLTDSIQRSCNPYFMSLAGTLGSKAMVNTFELVGFGKRSGILLPSEDPGFLPGSDTWRRKYPGASMTRATLAQFAIGQSQSLATPLQVCSVASTIANGGKYYQPRIVRRIFGEDPNGEAQIIKENIPIVKTNLIDEGVSRAEMDMIRLGMWKAVNELGGTATKVALEDVFVAAKTGTAQTGKTNIEHTHNAWTTSFAPFEKPRYAICVMVENGKSGGAVAGVLSQRIYREIFNMEAGLNMRITHLGTYAGNFEAFEKIEIPEGEIYSLTDSEEGETGDEIEDVLLSREQPNLITPNENLLPSIAPTPDREADSN